MASNIKEQAKKQFELNGQSYTYYDLQTLEEKGLAKISKLPYSIRVLLESVLRQEDDFVISMYNRMNISIGYIFFLISNFFKLFK